MAVGAADASDAVVLGPTVVEGAAVAALLRVVHGTVVPSRKQFLEIGQFMSKHRLWYTHTTPL